MVKYLYEVGGVSSLQGDAVKFVVAESVQDAASQVKDLGLTIMAVRAIAEVNAHTPSMVL